MRAFGDPAQPIGTVPCGVQAGDVGEQHLGGADVRRCPFAADVLLAGLQCEAQRRPSSGVRADADEAAGQGASGVLLHGDERGVGAAVAHRDTEALRRSDGDVSAELTGRDRQGAGQEISGDDGQAANCVDALDGGRPVAARRPSTWGG